MSNLHVMRHKRRQAMKFNQAMTKNMQKNFKYTKMFKVNKIHDIKNFMNFCPMACCYDSKTLLAISHDFKFRC